MDHSPITDLNTLKSESVEKPNEEPPNVQSPSDPSENPSTPIKQPDHSEKLSTLNKKPFTPHQEPSDPSEKLSTSNKEPSDEIVESSNQNKESSDEPKECLDQNKEHCDLSGKPSDKNNEPKECLDQNKERCDLSGKPSDKNNEPADQHNKSSALKDDTFVPSEEVADPTEQVIHTVTTQNCEALPTKKKDTTSSVDSQELADLAIPSLKSLLDEALSYKNPKDRYNKSELFRNLLEDAEKKSEKDDLNSELQHRVFLDNLNSNKESNNARLKDRSTSSAELNAQNAALSKVNADTNDTPVTTSTSTTIATTTPIRNHPKQKTPFSDGLRRISLENSCSTHSTGMPIVSLNGTITCQWPVIYKCLAGKETDVLSNNREEGGAELDDEGGNSIFRREAHDEDPSDEATERQLRKSFYENRSGKTYTTSANIEITPDDCRDNNMDEIDRAYVEPECYLSTFQARSIMMGPGYPFRLQNSKSEEEAIAAEGQPLFAASSDDDQMFSYTNDVNPDEPAMLPHRKKKSKAGSYDVNPETSDAASNNQLDYSVFMPKIYQNAESAPKEACYLLPNNNFIYSVTDPRNAGGLTFAQDKYGNKNITVENTAIQSGSRIHKLKLKKKNKTTQKDVLYSQNIKGHCGDMELEELLSFIEDGVEEKSKDSSGKSKTKGGKHKEIGNKKSKKRPAVKNRANKDPKESISQDESRESKDVDRGGEEGGGEEEDHSDSTLSPPSDEYVDSVSQIPDSDFRLVEKKVRKRKNKNDFRSSATIRSRLPNTNTPTNNNNFRKPINPPRIATQSFNLTQPPQPSSQPRNMSGEIPRRRRRKSIPSLASGRESDCDSVHSLPVVSNNAKYVTNQQSSSSGCTPQASYADIAKSPLSSGSITEDNCRWFTPKTSPNSSTASSERNSSGNSSNAGDSDAPVMANDDSHVGDTRASDSHVGDTCASDSHVNETHNTGSHGGEGDSHVSGDSHIGYSHVDETQVGAPHIGDSADKNLRVSELRNGDSHVGDMRAGDSRVGEKQCTAAMERCAQKLLNSCSDTNNNVSSKIRVEKVVVTTKDETFFVAECTENEDIHVEFTLKRPSLSKQSSNGNDPADNNNYRDASKFDVCCNVDRKDVNVAQTVKIRAPKSVVSKNEGATLPPDSCKVAKSLSGPLKKEITHATVAAKFNSLPDNLAPSKSHVADKVSENRTLENEGVAIANGPPTRQDAFDVNGNPVEHQSSRRRNECTKADDSGYLSGKEKTNGGAIGGVNRQNEKGGFDKQNGKGGFDKQNEKSGVDKQQNDKGGKKSNSNQAQNSREDGGNSKKVKNCNEANQKVSQENSNKINGGMTLASGGKSGKRNSRNKKKGSQNSQEGGHIIGNGDASKRENTPQVYEQGCDVADYKGREGHPKINDNVATYREDTLYENAYMSDKFITQNTPYNVSTDNKRDTTFENDQRKSEYGRSSRCHRTVMAQESEVSSDNDEMSECSELAPPNNNVIKNKPNIDGNWRSRAPEDNQVIKEDSKIKSTGENPKSHINHDSHMRTRNAPIHMHRHHLENDVIREEASDSEYNSWRTDKGERTLSRRERQNMREYENNCARQGRGNDFEKVDRRPRFQMEPRSSEMHQKNIAPAISQRGDDVTQASGEQVANCSCNRRQKGAANKEQACKSPSVNCDLYEQKNKRVANTSLNNACQGNQCHPLDSGERKNEERGEQSELSKAFAKSQKLVKMTRERVKEALSLPSVVQIGYLVLEDDELVNSPDEPARFSQLASLRARIVEQSSNYNVKDVQNYISNGWVELMKSSNIRFYNPATDV